MNLSSIISGGKREITGDEHESAGKLPRHKFEIEEADPEEEDEEYCPIEQVKLTVAATDDPTEAALTFRTWFLGIIMCVLLSFANQFFVYRQNSLSIGTVVAQIVALPMGRLMARVLPTTTFHVPLTGWSFSLNPGPFTIKEHVLITIFANCGSGGVYSLSIVTILKALYHRPLHPLAACFLVLTTQMLGYGWAGIFRRILVDSPYMWWPGNMTNISLFRTMHEEDEREKGGLSRGQFFMMVFVASFAYYVVPAYFFPVISSISLLCYIGKGSILMQQLGSGLQGMGIGSFALDWATANMFADPIATPGFAIVNVLIGFILVMYVLTPITYFNNIYDARKFPFFTSHVFDDTGHPYNITRIINQATFSLDIPSYNAYSKLHLSGFFAFDYGIGFATLSATIVHVALYHGETIWALWMKTKNHLHGKLDVHSRLMKKNYESVPNWWFYIILAIVFALSLFACEGFGKQLQLPWWGLILACVMAFIFTLPIGIIQATTNVQMGLNIITEMLIGYIYPGRPLANVVFKTYGYISMTQALSFLSDFKLGHYMKIPPKSMFVAQLAGTVVASSVYLGTAWWLLETVEHICDVSALPDGNPWTCPSDNVFYNASIIWGVIGPMRMFTSKGVYGGLNWWFLVGAVAPLPAYFLSRRYPEKKWLQLINMPIILGASGWMPPSRSVNYIMWGAVGIYFNIYVYRVHRKWWARHAYVLSAAMNAGVAFMGVLLYFALQSYDISIEWWGMGGGGGDNCPLAKCPTAPGIAVDGCPLH